MAGADRRSCCGAFSSSTTNGFCNEATYVRGERERKAFASSDSPVDASIVDLARCLQFRGKTSLGCLQKPDPSQPATMVALPGYYRRRAGALSVLVFFILTMFKVQAQSHRFW